MIKKGFVLSNYSIYIGLLAYSVRVCIFLLLTLCPEIKQRRILKHVSYVKWLPTSISNMFARQYSINTDSIAWSRRSLERRPPDTRGCMALRSANSKTSKRRRFPPQRRSNPFLKLLALLSSFTSTFFKLYSSLVFAIWHYVSEIELIEKLLYIKVPYDIHLQSCQKIFKECWFLVQQLSSHEMK